MTKPLLFGIIAGLGLWLIAVGWRGRRAPLAQILTNLDTPYVPPLRNPTTILLSRVTGSVAGSVSPELGQDLAVLNLTVADHTRAKLQNAVFIGAFGLLTLTAFGATSGVWLPPIIITAIGLGGAGLGWIITDRVTRQRANARRAEFRSTLVTYLQLVAIFLAGGAGTNQALTQVTRFGVGPGFDEIEAALVEARVRGTSPWQVFNAVATRKRLLELEELSAAVELAGTSGARVRQSLLAKATALRQAELANASAEAAKASETMGVPIGLMMLGFVVLVGYPALTAVMSIS